MAENTQRARHPKCYYHTTAPTFSRNSFIQLLFLRVDQYKYVNLEIDLIKAIGIN